MKRAPAVTPKRISAREGARFVLGKLCRDDAQDLYVRLNGPGSSFTADAPAFRAIMEATGIEEAMHNLGHAMTLGTPTKRAGGRVGRPVRDWLRAELRALRVVIAKNVDPSDGRHLSRVIASLILLYQFDGHEVWWSGERPHPPQGGGRYGRVGWLVKRIGDLCDTSDVGQYQRRARTPTV